MRKDSSSLKWLLKDDNYNNQCHQQKKLTRVTIVGFNFQILTKQQKSYSKMPKNGVMIWTKLLMVNTLSLRLVLFNLMVSPNFSSRLISNQQREMWDGFVIKIKILIAMRQLNVVKNGVRNKTRLFMEHTLLRITMSVKVKPRDPTNSEFISNLQQKRFWFQI